MSFCKAVALTVPPWVNVDTPVRCSQVETHTATLEYRNHDLDRVVVVEGLDRLSALLQSHLALTVSARRIILKEIQLTVK